MRRIGSVGIIHVDDDLWQMCQPSSSLILLQATTAMEEWPQNEAVLILLWRDGLRMTQRLCQSVEAWE